MKQHIIIAILFILLAGSVSAATQTGFFVISSGKANFQSNDPTVGGNVWLVTVSQNGAGLALAGSFGTDIFTDPNAGVKAQYPLLLSSVTKSESISWLLNKQTATISDPEYSQINVLLNPLTSLTTMQNQCFAAHQGQNPLFSKAPVSIYAYCIWFDNDRPIAEVSPQSQKSFDVQLTATSNGQTVTGDITNAGQSSINLGDKVYATWVGSLSSGTDITFPADTLFVWLPNSGKWQAISRANYGVYKGAYGALYNCLQGIGGQSGAQCIQQYQSSRDIALAGQQVTLPGATTQMITGGATNGQFVIGIDAPLQFPVLSMKIRADYLGIIQLVGVPKIDSFGSQTDLSTGNTLNEQVNVRNIGQYTGVFDVFATCNAPLSSTARIRTKVDSLQMQSVFIPIVGSTAADTTAACTYTAVDINNPNNKDTLSKTYNLKTVVVCTPDQQRCNGATIEKCAADGSKFVPLQTCATSCAINNGAGQCAQKCTPGANACINSITQVCASDGSAFAPTSPPAACGGQVCQDSVYGLVKAQTGNTQVCDFWCKIGITQPTTAVVCVNDYTPLIIFLLVLGFIIVLAVYKKMKHGKRGQKQPLPDWLVGENGLIRSKGFWIGILIILGFAVIVGFWTYFFWALVIAAILGVIYVIGRGVVFRGKIRL